MNGTSRCLDQAANDSQTETAVRNLGPFRLFFAGRESGPEDFFTQIVRNAGAPCPQR